MLITLDFGVGWGPCSSGYHGSETIAGSDFYDSTILQKSKLAILDICERFNFHILGSPFADRSSARSFFSQDRFGVDRDLNHVANDDATSV